MSYLEAVIQGIVQGLTEFLPVSSSGHLSIVQHIVGVTENNLFFNVMLHLGTLVAVCAVYRKLILKLAAELIHMIKDIFTGKFRWSQMNYERNLIMMLIIGLLPLLLLFVPIPFSGGLNANDLAEIWSGGKYFAVVGISLICTSLLLLVGDIANKNTTKKYIQRGIMREDGAGRRKFKVPDAVCVGIMQLIAAVFPGLSRSGSTLAMAQVRGINKQKALDYTFVLAIPAILAAALLELKDAVSAPEDISINFGVIIVGMAVSAVVGYISIILFKWLLKTDKMYIFMIYTAVVGVLVVIISIIEGVKGVNIFSGAAL